MKARGRWLRGTSVRRKLLVLATAPVLLTGVLLTSVFLSAHEASSRAYERALAWEHYAEALRNLDWAARLYVDTVGDRITRDPVSHAAESKDKLMLARAEALRMAKRFSLEEQTSGQRLDARLGALVSEGEHLDKDRGRLVALKGKYDDEIDRHIRRRVASGEDGSARALHAAQKFSDAVHAGGGAVALLALAAAFWASVVTTREFGERVASLQAAAARVAAGDLGGKIPVNSADELGQLADSLNVMVEALRRQRSRQLGFLAGVAHDLKNPLGAIRFSAEALRQGADELPEPALRKSFSIVERQIERLARLADDLLDATSIEAGELKIQPAGCDLRTVARDIVELYADASPKHEIVLTMPDEPVVTVCDRTRVGQVLDNLVNNAIKYSPDGGAIEVIVMPGPEDVVISVTDHGVGIDPGMYEAVFEPFRRASPSKDIIPGVGLGLSICRRIVMAHGGRIDVTSKVGRGTTFEVRLPRHPVMTRPPSGFEQADHARA